MSPGEGQIPILDLVNHYFNNHGGYFPGYLPRLESMTLSSSTAPPPLLVCCDLKPIDLVDGTSEPTQLRPLSFSLPGT